MLHLYPEESDEAIIEETSDNNFQQQHYNQGITGDSSAYQNQYYSNQ